MSLKENRFFRAAKRRAYASLLLKRRMKHPSFGAALHDEIGGKQDYFRYATLALALERLELDKIEGSLAEVGVYRGETSRIIHAAAPERRLYLLDTFEGFPAEHLETWQQGDIRFKDTSFEAVATSFMDAPNVHIRPGTVPQTLEALKQERFAFVLLDLDLYSPTLASLDFFYPRLETGGYLVVHDYNNPESDWACKRALDTFLADKPEFLIEIGDLWGTAMIRKCAA